MVRWAGADCPGEGWDKIGEYNRILRAAGNYQGCHNWADQKGIP